MSIQYTLFLAIVACQVGLEVACITLHPPISPVDWALAMVSTALALLLIGRIVIAWKTPKLANTCALTSSAVGALVMAVFSLLTFTPIAEAFVLVKGPRVLGVSNVSDEQGRDDFGDHDAYLWRRKKLIGRL